MNKNIITKFVAMAGVALMALSCQTDYFNEHYLPGYNNDGTITDVQEASITLTDDDYAAIAKNATNVALAQAEGEEATAALAAIGKNKYFATQDEVAAYMPAFIGAKYPVWDDGSLVLATYTLALDIPEDVMLMNAATEYTLTEDDYKTIWASEEDYANALTPKTINKLKSVIPVADDAREGDYVVVTYNYSDEEPATETPETPETPDTPEQPETPAYTSVLATAAVGDVIEVKGYVSAMSTQGPVITDASGSILLYKYTDLAIGDVVTVNGTVAAYNFGLQFDYSKGGVTVEKTGYTAVTYPTPMDITGEKADELLTSRTENELCHFAKMHGVLSISTNSDGTKTYYNFNIDGAETAVGSLYNPTEEIVEQLTNDTEYTLYGYFTSISKSSGAPKYINMIVVSVNEAPAIDGGEATNNYTSVLGTVALGDTVEVKGYVSAMSTQGPIVTDNSGSILLYKYTDLAIGDVVTVNGTVAAYNFGLQFDYSKGGVTVEKTGYTAVTYPTPMDITGEKADELLTSRTENELCHFAKMHGVLSISTNSDGTKTYYNFNIDGAETAVGSLYNPTEEIVEQLTNDTEYTLYGYFTSISKSSGAPKYINMIVVSVNEAPAIDGGNAYTSVLGSAAKGDVVEVNGYISALSTQGPILTDNGGSVLIYKAANLGLVVGDEVTVSGPIGSYNCGFQIDYSKGDVTVEKTGTTTVKYPTPMDITGAAADNLLVERTYDDYAIYAKMSGQVVVSGNYFNFTIDGAEKAEGSVYGATDEVKAMLKDGLECTLYGYFCSISKYGDPKEPKFINMVVTSVEPAAVPSRLALTVKSEKRYAYFKYNGTGYEAANVVAIQPADYTAMGQNYGNFTNPDQDYYLPTFLNNTYPYAEVDDKMYVAYRCYANSATTWKVDEYVFDGAWSKTIYFTEKTDQFRKGEGKWNIDRTLELNYTNTSSPDTRAFYQYCVNWVYDFKDVPMGAPARDNEGVIITTDIVMIDGQKPAGNYWVSNYGNNEFYTGASAYYGNIDWRPSAVKGGFTAAGMGDLSDDEILAKLKEHSAEVFAEVLSYMFPEMTPDEYKKVVIVVYAYGPNANYSFTFDVVETGKFAYVADSITEL